MNFLDLVKSRCSVRKFKDKMVEEEKLKYVLEAGRLAPSAGNRQPWYFIVLQQSKLKAEVIDTYLTYQKSFAKDVPALIVICGDHNQAWRRRDGKDHCDIDVSIAIDHMMLAAAEVGLGTCWIGGFDSMQCHKILNLPLHMEAIALLPIGYPENVPSSVLSKNRKALEEVVFWDKLPEISK